MTTPASPTSNWQPTLNAWEPSVAKAAQACAQFVAEIERNAPPRWLTLLGAAGSGKTMLVTQTFREALKHRDAATADHPEQAGLYDETRRRPGSRWIDETRFAHLYLTDHQYDLPEYIAHEWIVCFDDLGSKRDGKEVLADAIFRLANQRLGKWTLWSTNLTLDEIAKRIDPRVSSRLIRDGNRIVTITAGDYARRQK